MVTQILRLLDQIRISDSAKRHIQLLHQIDKVLQRNLDSINVNEKARVLIVMSQADQASGQGIRIVNMIIRDLQKRLEEFDENSVIYVLEAYKHLLDPSPQANYLFNKLNDTVTTLAQQNQELVTPNFLIQYLSAFHDLPNNRKLRAAQFESLLELLK